MRRAAARTLATVVAVGVALAACRGEPDPRDELAAAVRATEAVSVTFTVAAVADRGALDTLEGAAAEAAAFLQDAGLVGARDPDGALRLAADLGGDEPLLEVVSLPDGPLLLRTGLGSMLGLGRGDPADDLEPALARIGVDEAGRRALAVSFAGGWLELTDVADVDAAVADLLGRGADDGVALGDLSGMLGAVTVQEARDAGEVRRLDVVVDPSALPGAAAGGEPLPATVVLRDGLVQEVRVELPSDTAGGGSGAGGEAGGSGGVVEVVLTLQPVAEGRAVLRPEADAQLTARQLLDLVDRLQEAALVPAP